MTTERKPEERAEVERQLEEREDERRRQWSGSTPDEGVMERALRVEPEDEGVERHAGEDPGVTDPPRE